MVKKIKQNLYQRFKSQVPSVIKKIQIFSASIAGIDMVLIATRDKFPEFNIPEELLSIVLWASIINAVILQFTTHKDFEK